MYKYVKEFTQPLRDFDYSTLNKVDTKKDYQEYKEKSKTRDDKKKEKAFLQDQGFYIDTVTCLLCDKEIRNNRRSVMNHENSRGHQKRLAPVQNEYKKIKKFFRRFVLRGKRPIGRGLKRLKYYRMIMTYRSQEDLQGVFGPVEA